MSKDIIVKGDIITVYWHDGILEHCKVLHVPSATGDSWHLRTDEGALVYVQTFKMIIKAGSEEKDNE